MTSRARRRAGSRGACRPRRRQEVRRIGRPAVILSASVAPTTSSPISSRRCCGARTRPEPPDPGEQQPDVSTASRNQPASREVAVGLPRRPSASMTSRSAAGDRVAVPDDDLALGDRHHDGPTFSAAPVAGLVGQRLVERRVGTTSGAMISAASIRSASSRSPPIRPRCSPSSRHLVSRSSVAQRRVEDARRLRPDGAQRSASIARSVAARFAQARDRRLEERPALLGA